MTGQWMFEIFCEAEPEPGSGRFVATATKTGTLYATPVSEIRFGYTPEQAERKAVAAVLENIARQLRAKAV